MSPRIHPERIGRVLGAVGGALGLLALAQPFGRVDGVVLGLPGLGTLDPGVAVGVLAIGATTLAGGIVAFADPARGEQLLGTAAGVLLVAVATSRVAGATIAPGAGTHLVVLGFGLAEAGDLLDPAYRNPHASTTVAVGAVGVFVLASWCFLLVSDAVGWVAGGVAVLAWFVALLWEVTGVRD